MNEPSLGPNDNLPKPPRQTAFFLASGFDLTLGFHLPQTLGKNAMPTDSSTCKGVDFGIEATNMAVKIKVAKQDEVNA